mgnify:CR=1 FL=1
MHQESGCSRLASWIRRLPSSRFATTDQRAGRAGTALGRHDIIGKRRQVRPGLIGREGVRSRVPLRTQSRMASRYVAFACAVSWATSSGSSRVVRFILRKPSYAPAGSARAGRSARLVDPHCLRHVDDAVELGETVVRSISAG